MRMRLHKGASEAHPDQQEIPAVWRAAIVPESGGEPIFGFSSRVGKRRAVVNTDRHLPSGYRCKLALMLPKGRSHDEQRILEVPGSVSTSVLNATQFNIILNLQHNRWSDEALLGECIRQHQQTWKRS